MRRPALPVVCVLVLVVPLAVVGATAGVAVGADTGADGSAADLGSSSAVDSESPAAMSNVTGDVAGEFGRTPSTTFHVRLRSDRDAAWTVSVRYEFTDSNETAAFEAVADDFENGTAGPSVTLYRNLAGKAAERTGREMRITGVEREVTVDRSPDVDDESVVAVGTLELRFVWTNFLAQDGEQLLLGDVFRTENNGTWLRTLGENQRLIIETPDQYRVSSTPGVSVSLKNNAVVIEGPRTFGPDQYVQVVYSPTGVVGRPPWLLLAGAVVLAGLIVVVGLFAYRRLTDPNPGVAGGRPDAGTGESGGASGGETGANGGGPRAGRAAADGEAAGEGSDAAPAAGAAGGAGGVGDDADSTEEDLSLLSDTERVERLLERNGGRMRQADIVEMTDWSDAKVSQLLSSMADEDRVEKLRLGRENLISLPEYGEDADEE